MSEITRENQEKLIRASIMEQEAKQLEQQLGMIEQHIIELGMLKTNLDELDKVKPGNELLANIGRNIFVKTELKSKELLVDIGSRIVVKKDTKEVKGLINRDIEKLVDVRDNLAQQLELIIREISLSR